MEQLDKQDKLNYFIYKNIKQEVMMDSYWKLNIYKDGVLRSSFECENDNVILTIAEDAKRKGLDIEVERCSRIKNFIESVYGFIKKKY